MHRADVFDIRPCLVAGVFAGLARVRGSGGCFGGGDAAEEVRTDPDDDR